MAKLALILVNVGSPDSFEKREAKAFIGNMVSDRHVVNKPYIARKFAAFFAANFGAGNFAKRLAECAVNSRSALRHYTTAFRAKISDRLSMQVLSAYLYTGPSIDSAVQYARKKGATEFMFLPLFPQYCWATTQAARAKIEAVMSKYKRQWCITDPYCSEDFYINALCKSAENAVKNCKTLLALYHSVPNNIPELKRYALECEKTSALMAKTLGCQVLTAYISARGSEKKWLSPSGAKTVGDLAKSGKKNLAVICPGFAMDCTETLLDVKRDLKKVFIENGGKHFEYVPCLNDSNLQSDVVEAIFCKYE